MFLWFTSQSLEKTLTLEISGMGEKRVTEDEVVVGLSNLREVVKGREAWRAAAHGVAKSRMNLATGQFSRNTGHTNSPITTKSQLIF